MLTILDYWKKPIKFIFAVREDLLKDAESQTKFFDFIVPIIPAIDSENSFDILNNKIQNFKEENKEHHFFKKVCKKDFYTELSDTQAAFLYKVKVHAYSTGALQEEYFKTYEETLSALKVSRTSAERTTKL
ncbi:hypothetical protein J4731_08390 [Providencia rettgeri]|nr:hypothetical protein [Providencia rettgeri]